MILDRRRARTLAYWLLPLWVLRLLLPVGVMPGMAHGAPALVLCSLSLHFDASLDAGRAHSPGGHDPTTQPDQCPFGTAAHLAPVTAIEPIRFGFATVLVTVDAETGRALALIGPPRTQLSRAPPTFS
jgi:hypothetical protein